MPPITAVVFDAYGTLFDVHSIAAAADAEFPGKGAALSLVWRTKQLEYTWLRSLMRRYEDFSAITRSGLQAACRILDLQADDETISRLTAAYDKLALYPDAREALAGLESLKLAILSNGSPSMLDAVVQNAGLDGTFDAVISVDEIGVFKPAPRVYELARTRLAVPKSEIAFVSANYWDAAGAKNFGFQVYWINRAGAPPECLGATPDAELSRLTELARHIGVA